MLLCMCLLVALAACSTIRLGYEKLPFLVGWQVDRYLDLTSEQEAMVDRRLRSLQAWHRESQLPKYVALLRQVQEQIDEPMTVERIAAWRGEGLSAWEALVDRLAPAVAELAVTLSPAQIAHLERRLAEANQEIEREYFVGSRPAVRRENRIRRSRERAEDFLGPLNAPQLARVAQRADAEGTRESSHWWSLRLPRQQILVGLLQELSTTRPPPDVATARAKAGLLELAFPTEPALRVKADAAAEAGDHYLADMLQQMSVAQRRHLREKLERYRSELEGLASAAAG